MFRLSALLCVIAAVGCATSGGTRIVTESAPTGTGIDGPRGVFEITRDRTARSDTIDFAPGRVWGALTPVLASLNIGVEHADSAQLTVVSRNTEFRRVLGGVRMSTYVECGVSAMGKTADRYPVYLRVTTTVREGPPGGSVVHTSVQAVARPEDNGASSVSCESSGKLERRISAQVANRLAGS
jgi:hypothetical protein